MKDINRLLIMFEERKKDIVTSDERHLTPTQACCDLTVKQLSAVPDVFHDGQWKIEAEFFDLDFRHRFLATVNDDQFEAGMLKLLEESKRWKNIIWELRITRKLFDFYYDTGQSYDMALYARKIERRVGKECRSRWS